MDDQLQQEYSDLIKKLGAKAFIGSKTNNDFEEHGKIHLIYLQDQGLLPTHKLLDVGCGALRSARHIIPYLDTGNYYGIDRMPELVEFGLNESIEKDIIFNKKPTLSVNSYFDFSFVKEPVDYVWIQSVFSHLVEEDIKLCLTNLKNCIGPNTMIYFTYFPQEERPRHLNSKWKITSHSKIDIKYDPDVMDIIVKECGYRKLFNGDVNHPRRQYMYCCKI